tara:strand:- start:83 stop:298 length:216 start_codon:yes stop_codon:yes gene_type:complete
MSEETKKQTTYIVDIASVYGVDEKTADEIKERQDSQNQEWLIDQVKKGLVYVCDVIEEDGFEHTGEENETE